MDGVLIDSEPVHQQILSQTFQELGISLLDEYYYTLVGMAAGPMWEKIKADFALHEEVGSLVKKTKYLRVNYYRPTLYLQPQVFYHCLIDLS